MTNPLAKPIVKRTDRHRRTTPASAGLPDPRPVTGYTVSVAEEEGNTVLTITLEQPCVIREPNWAAVSSADGSTVGCESVKVNSNTEFALQFTGTLKPECNFIEVPYQDMQVQNFQGGYVAPGARWFRPL